MTGSKELLFAGVDPLDILLEEGIHEVIERGSLHLRQVRQEGQNVGLQMQGRHEARALPKELAALGGREAYSSFIGSLIFVSLGIAKDAHRRLEGDPMLAPIALRLGRVPIELGEYGQSCPEKARCWREEKSSSMRAPAVSPSFDTRAINRTFFSKSICKSFGGMMTGNSDN